MIFEISLRWGRKIPTKSIKELIDTETTPVKRKGAPHTFLKYRMTIHEMKTPMNKPKNIPPLVMNNCFQGDKEEKA